MSKFEIGKWYSWSQRGMQPQYGKVSELQECTVHMSPWIINQISYDDSGYFDPCNSTDIREISVDVVRNFLPAGHPDLEVVRGSSSNSTSSNTLTELPEKWCIRIATKEINDAINRKGLYPSLELYWEDSPNYTTYYVTSGELYLSSKPNDHVELTEDQFKKWVLKEKVDEAPSQKFAEPPNPNTTEQWTPKVGEWVMINESQLPITDCWLGEGGRVTHQGPFKVEKFIGGCVTRMSGINVMLDAKTRFRKALPHEIPSPQERLNAGTVTPGELYMEMSGLSFKNPNESLLEEAKRKYPVGTKFKCLVVREEYFVPEGVSFKNENGSIYSYVNNGIFHKHYDGERWAEIIEEPKTHPEYVECLRDSSNGTYTKGRIYRVKSSDTYKDSNHGFYFTERDDKNCTTNGYGKINFKPSTREAYERQEGISNISVSNSVGLVESRQVSGLGASRVSSELGGSRDFINPVETAQLRYLEGLSERAFKEGMAAISRPYQYLAGVDPIWEDVARDLYGRPMYDRNLTPAERLQNALYGGNKKVSETSLKPQPSPKITVKSHEEFKITVTKPKQIKL